MAKFRATGRWARSFVAGDYRGAPVDFVMAISIIATMILVTLVG